MAESKLFKLEVLTPERLFLRHEVQALTFAAPDGQITVLAGHAPMVAAVDVGEMRVKMHDEWRVIATTEGFVEVRPDEVLMFVQAAEWPDEIDIARAKEAKERAEERLRQRKSIAEHKQSEISLARAMVRLRVGGIKTGKK